MAFFDQQAQVPNQTFTALETAMKGQSAACAACIFGHDTDPAWRPIVYVGAGGGAFFNYGACFARAAGGSNACGAALERTELCLDAVCSVDDCGSDAAAKTCAQGAAANPASCGKYDPPTACGGAANLQALDAKCATALDAIKVMCGGA